MKLVHVFKTAAQAARAEVYENTTVAHIEEGANISCIQPAGRIIRQNRWCWRPMRSLQDWDSSGTRSCRHEYVAVTQPFSGSATGRDRMAQAGTVQ